MSESTEMFDEKFGTFFDRLESLIDDSDQEDLRNVVDAFFVAPEMVSEYLANCSRLIELRATIEARIDHKKQLPMPAAGQRARDRTERVYAYRDLVSSWRNVLATCEDSEQISGLIQDYLARRI